MIQCTPVLFICLGNYYSSVPLVRIGSMLSCPCWPHDRTPCFLHMVVYFLCIDHQNLHHSLQHSDTPSPCTYSSTIRYVPPTRISIEPFWQWYRNVAMQDAMCWWNKSNESSNLTWKETQHWHFLFTIYIGLYRFSSIREDHFDSYSTDQTPLSPHPQKGIMLPTHQCPSCPHLKQGLPPVLPFAPFPITGYGFGFGGWGWSVDTPPIWLASGQSLALHKTINETNKPMDGKQ